MKFLHLSDLHLGKSLHNRSLIEDQAYLLRQITDSLKSDPVQAVLISGDIYDRSWPSREGQRLFSDFLTELAEMDIDIMIIAGNHDDADRLEFVSDILKKSRIHIAGIPEKELKCITLSDEYGPVNFYLLPYTVPVQVRSLFPEKEEEIRTYDDALKVYMAEQKIDTAARNVILSHQMVTYSGKLPEFSESEISVGGVGAVDAEIFDSFDYAALGHIHMTQKAGKGAVWYAGTPMCYHFSEEKQQPEKGGFYVELKEKGSKPEMRKLILSPLHPLRTVTGTFEEILAEEKTNGRKNEYIRVQLLSRPSGQDEQKILRTLFESKESYMLDITRNAGSAPLDRNPGLSYTEIREASLEDLFQDFYMSRENELPDALEFELICHISEAVRALPKTEDAAAVSEIREAKARASEALAAFLLKQEAEE